jgi:hypothetical protein
VRAASERGSVPIALAGVMTIAMAALTTLAVADVAVLRTRVGATADMAALAAVTHGCAWAQRIAEADARGLDECVAQGADMRVTVSTASPALVERLTGFHVQRITASAVAGPP